MKRFVYLFPTRPHMAQKVDKRVGVQGGWQHANDWGCLFTQLNLSACLVDLQASGSCNEGEWFWHLSDHRHRPTRITESKILACCDSLDGNESLATSLHDDGVNKPVTCWRRETIFRQTGCQLFDSSANVTPELPTHRISQWAPSLVLVRNVEKLPLALVQVDSEIVANAND